MKSSDYLTYYASKFKTVEIDSTYYGTPSASTVTAWHQHFVFAAKVPQSITHEKVLIDCDAEFGEFMETMHILGEKLGPLVFQFPHFDRWKFAKQEDFLAALRPFLKKLPTDHKFAIEIRNKTWLNAVFAGLLRKGIKEQTTTWDKTVVDRREDLSKWVGLFRQFVSKNLKVFAYANNHYAGNGPGTVKLFWNMWKKR